MADGAPKWPAWLDFAVFAAACAVLGAGAVAAVTLGVFAPRGDAVGCGVAPAVDPATGQPYWRIEGRARG